MAMAATLGLTVVEAFDRKTVAAEKVKADNRRYNQI